MYMQAYTYSITLNITYVHLLDDNVWVLYSPNYMYACIIIQQEYFLKMKHISSDLKTIQLQIVRLSFLQSTVCPYDG